MLASAFVPSQILSQRGFGLAFFSSDASMLTRRLAERTTSRPIAATAKDFIEHSPFLTFRQVPFRPSTGKMS
jgi:hypothetical protein